MLMDQIIGMINREVAYQNKEVTYPGKGCLLLEVSETISEDVPEVISISRSVYTNQDDPEKPWLHSSKSYYEPFPFEEEVIGKNTHSVLTKCLECLNIGINIPLETKCSNCGSIHTVTYYDAETIHQYIMNLKCK